MCGSEFQDIFARNGGAPCSTTDQEKLRLPRPDTVILICGFAPR